MPGTVETPRLRAVFFDVGETLVNEERYWREVAAAAGIDLHVVLAALGMTIARGADHADIWRLLGVPRPAAVGDLEYRLEDLYPDALPCLERVAELGFRIGLAGNQSEALERWTRAAFPAYLVGSSAGWRARKPSPAFFERMTVEAGCRPSELAYVGDRVDNDVLPALRAGLVAVHVRRGPWGRLQSTPPGAIGVTSLAEVPDAIASPR